jgi:hypothetical protein
MFMNRGVALRQKLGLLSFRPGFSPVSRLASSRITVLTVSFSSGLLESVVEQGQVGGCMETVETVP